MNLFEKQQNEFAGRHIGPGPTETTEMLATIGADSLEALIRKTIPDSIRIQGLLALPSATSEYEYLSELKEIAAKKAATAATESVDASGHEHAADGKFVEIANAAFDKNPQDQSTPAEDDADAVFAKE